MDKYTMKSTSDEGIYYLVNHWQKHKAFWIEPENFKESMAFDTLASAKASLTKLLKAMPDYKYDFLNMVVIKESWWKK